MKLRGVALKTSAIVGIDPGVTTAIAILNLDREILHLKSSKSFSLENALSFISSGCRPLIISCDVARAPKVAEKVAAAFSVKLFMPEEDISRLGKSRLVKEFDFQFRNTHERDALAAALIAHDSLRPFLRRIEERLGRVRMLTSFNRDEIARKIITGECRNINKAIASLSAKPDFRPVREQKRPAKAGFRTLLGVREREISALREMLSASDSKIKYLEKRLAESEEKLSARKSQTIDDASAAYERRTAALKTAASCSENEKRRLELEIEKYRAVFARLAQGWLPVLVAESCEKSVIKALDSRYGLEGKWLCIISDGKSSGLKAAKLSEGVFCTGTLLDTMRGEGVAALNLGDFGFEHAGDFGAVSVDRATLGKIKSERFASWLEGYKVRGSRQYPTR